MLLITQLFHMQYAGRVHNLNVSKFLRECLSQSHQNLVGRSVQGERGGLVYQNKQPRKEQMIWYARVAWI